MDVGKFGREVGFLMPTKSNRWRDVLVLLAGCFTAHVNIACNPGQCLRQSDCPMGSVCKKNMCKVPKPAPAQRDAGDKPSTTTTPNEATVDEQTSSFASSNDAAALSVDAATTAVSEQSSNLDSTSDTATTLSQ
jgi:hypothetical protein